MPVHIVFCSARDTNVPLVSRSPDWAGHVVLDTRTHGDVGCLARGRSCTGALCPFCAEDADRVEPGEAGRLDAPRPH